MNTTYITRRTGLDYTNVVMKTKINPSRIDGVFMRRFDNLRTKVLKDAFPDTQAQSFTVDEDDIEITFKEYLKAIGLVSPSTTEALAGELVASGRGIDRGIKMMLNHGMSLTVILFLSNSDKLVEATLDSGNDHRFGTIAELTDYMIWVLGGLSSPDIAWLD